MLDTWIYCTQAGWDAIAPTPAEEAVPQIWHNIYSESYNIFWKQWQGTHNVYNVAGSRAEVNALVTELGGSVAKVFAWGQGPGTDDLEDYPTLPDDILAVMKDHQSYDENGDPLPPVAATFDNPNWGHVFLGQGQRIFAGEFTNEFTGEFL